MPEEVVLALYTGDLFAVSLDHKGRAAGAKHRINAIEAVRTQILEDAERYKFNVHLEYVSAVCSSLLYYARANNPAGRIAYRCAAALVMEV